MGKKLHWVKIQSYYKDQDHKEKLTDTLVLQVYHGLVLNHMLDQKVENLKRLEVEELVLVIRNKLIEIFSSTKIFKNKKCQIFGKKKKKKKKKNPNLLKKKKKKKKKKS